jgi:hypothetical protein
LLVEKMQEILISEDYRFDAMVKAIVLSPQFLEKRGTSDREKFDVE